MVFLHEHMVEENRDHVHTLAICSQYPTDIHVQSKFILLLYSR